MEETERDWLKEAYEISEGKSSLLPQVEHLNALLKHIKALDFELARIFDELNKPMEEGNG